MSGTFDGQKKDEGDRRPNGQFAYGNSFAKGKGRPLRFETPEDLENLLIEYLQWVEANPLYELKAFGSGLTLRMPKMRAPSVLGFRAWSRTSSAVWDRYSDKDGYKDVIKDFEDMVFATNFEGAAAGLLSAAIIARKLGLSDKVETDQTVTVEVIDNFGDRDDDG
jgi:hypothetical protein